MPPCCAWRHRRFASARCEEVPKIPITRYASRKHGCDQRRAVWNRPQKAYLINTIFEGKPVPSIYIRHTLDLESEKSVKEVVDGQQRVRCLLEYRADEFAAPHPSHPRGVKYSGMTRTEREKFLLTALSVGYLIN